MRLRRPSLFKRCQKTSEMKVENVFSANKPGLLHFTCIHGVKCFLPASYVGSVTGRQLYLLEPKEKYCK